MIKRGFLLLLCLLTLTSVGGVYATWIYADGTPDPADISLNISLSVFNYKPEEILPGGAPGEVTPGQNHLALTDLILNESKNGYGLNYSTTVLLHTYLETQSVVFCNQKVKGGNLKHLLDLKNNTHELYYCIEKVNDTFYYIYTFTDDELLAAGNANNNSEITVYRTATEKKNGVWVATVSHIGAAQVKPLSAFNVDAAPNSHPYSIDVTTWHYS